METAENGRILIVDDSPTMQLLMGGMLARAGYEVLNVEEGVLAVERIRETQPHLILLDVMLPDLSGFEICRQLKQDEETCDIPVVFVSGLTELEDCIKGLQLGALDYIHKPVNKRILLTKAHTFVQLCRDARRLRQVNHELQHSHLELEQFSQALDNASDGVVITNPQGCITYTNRAFDLLALYTPRSEETNNIHHYFSDTAVAGRVMQGALEGVACTAETILRRGTMELNILTKCSPILDARGTPNGLLFLIIDQTQLEKSEADRKRLEMELFQSQKLEAVGQLAAGIAHEINTPVQFVGDNIRFMQDALQDLFDLQEIQGKLLDVARTQGVAPELVGQVERALETADLEYLVDELPNATTQSLEGVDRVASIVRAMKEFAHPGTTEKAPANLNDAIKTTVTVARNKWKYVATLDTEFDENLPLVPCLIGEFNQVILNLIVNASDAIGDVVGESGSMGQIRISTHLNENHARIEVADTGGGIPEKIRTRIFDPFFTTKEVGKGSGQGLAIAHGVIVNKHQGQFDFKTEVGKGTTFIIELPIDEAA